MKQKLWSYFHSYSGVYPIILELENNVERNLILSMGNYWIIRLLHFANLFAVIMKWNVKGGAETFSVHIVRKVMLLWCCVLL